MHTKRNGAWTGETLRRWRLIGLHGERKKPLTQEYCADWYGVSERQWRRYERSESRVPTPLILRIADQTGERS
jgi:hypothetical protein